MFHLPTEATIYLIEEKYSMHLVLLSFLIAFGASYTALFINKQIKNNGFFNRNVWLLLASLAMGLGIWSMHFIGMMAFQLPVEIKHNTFITIISAIPAILASFLAFYLANEKKQTLRTLVIASLWMGAGISSMHYIGMYGMKVDVQYVYKFWPFIMSISIAIIASFASLLIFTYGTKITDKILVKLAAALVMAIAIASMHYTGMFATQFYSYTEISYHGTHVHSNNFSSTIILIAVGITLLYLIAFLTSRFDSYVNVRIKNFDPLTNLPNHNQFMEDQQQNPESTFLAIVHIQNIERYVMAYGYTFGDEILMQVQEIIIKVLPNEAKVYRTEANRFTVVAPNGMDHYLLRISLEQICSVLAKQMLVNNRFVTIEMAVAVSTSENKEPIHVLFSNAIAVLKSPTTTFNYQLVQFNPQLHTFNFERQITIDVDKAMKENQLYLVYQPKVEPKLNTIVGLEALIRWQHPEYGFLSPSEFIPILENTNRITDLTDWIIGKVCSQIEEWNDLNFQFKQVSINVPGSYITSPKLVQVLNESVKRHNVHPNQIELEITETSFIHDIHNAIQAVRSLREKGYFVALDDFGTGLSSLSYLKEIPINTIKIDKSFVDGVPNYRKDASILKAILSLCHSLDLNVVLEGVELQQQIDFLLSTEDYPVVQGYYYSKPLKPFELHEWSKNINIATV